MKKYLFFAAAAAMLTACSSEELATAPQEAQDQPISFDVYTQRAVTRAGLPGNDGTSYAFTTAKMETEGFGVFAYYTDNNDYDPAKSTPNFMYNQKVIKGAFGTTTATWKYEPAKYWPNEFGDAAASDEVDKLTFFAYAPYVDVDVTNGVPVGATEDELNITALSKNSATGDPIVKYLVDTNPATSVDLCWGVAADATSYTPIALTGSVPAEGDNFENLVKENSAANGKINWLFKHALAQLNVQVIMNVDKETPTTDATTLVDANTNVCIREISLGGFLMKGALNLNSEDGKGANATPNWLAYDGATEAVYEGPVTFYDGFKDGKELTDNNIQKNEKPTGLNPILIAGGSIPTDAPVNLWDGAADADEPIYVIPTGEPMTCNIVYDVDTEDANLTGILSDGKTHGSSVENNITYTKGTGVDPTYVFDAIEAGKSYVVKIYVGLTSVKFEAEVKPWVTTPGSVDVELPENN